MKTMFLMTTLVLSSAAGSLAELPPLIPRDLLFGNPERTSPSLSPDGTRFVYSSPDDSKGNHGSLWTLPASGGEPKEIYRSSTRNLYDPIWSPDGRQLIYSADAGGTAHLYRMEIATGATQQLTAGAGEDIYPRCHP